MNRPSVEVFASRDVGPRDWGREILVAQAPGYIGKVIVMKAGSAGGLQYHRRKDETMLLVRGDAVIDYDNGRGELTRMVIEPGESVRVPPGAPHRVTAVSECLFVEFSSPHFDDRVRVEAEYGEPAVGGLPTTP